MSDACGANQGDRRAESTPGSQDPPERSERWRPDSIIIDARGRRCPLPILDLARHITDVDTGATITVEADDPAARPDVQAWCRMRGHEYAGESVAADGTPGYVVRRLH